MQADRPRERHGAPGSPARRRILAALPLLVTAIAARASPDSTATGCRRDASLDFDASTLAQNGDGPRFSGLPKNVVRPHFEIYAGGRLDAVTAAALRALDPDAISSANVRDVLARVPAPRIIALHGSVPLVTMEPFAQFLIAMGYPPERLRNPADASLTYGSYVDSRELAGAIAWHYERDGIAPLLIGHSQGGMAAIRALHELAGSFERPVPVFDPVAGAALPRTTIVDPLTQAARPVIGLQVPYAAAIATGKAMRILLWQWDMLSRLRRIPDSVEAFDGFFIPGDPFTAFDGDDDRYRAIGTAEVRNVLLPPATTHIGAPLAGHLAAQPVTREWIENFDPRAPAPAPAEAQEIDTRNLVHAAYIWHAVKRHWCRSARRLLDAGRLAAAT